MQSASAASVPADTLAPSRYKTGPESCVKFKNCAQAPGIGSDKGIDILAVMTGTALRENEDAHAESKERGRRKPRVTRLIPLSTADKAADNARAAHLIDALDGELDEVADGLRAAPGGVSVKQGAR